MNLTEHDEKNLSYVCCGNQEAMDFLAKWQKYVHAIDDIIDEEVTNEFIIQTFAQAIYIYSHSFYLSNIQNLRQIVINCTNAYADSVAFEKSEEQWQREFADHYRHFGCEMVIAVASICGGYLHCRTISLELRTACWMGHHDKETGKPI